jgi:hypothetical protein
MFDNTKFGAKQIGRPAPLWFRKFKKIWVNTENAVLALLLINHPPDWPVLTFIKIGSSCLLENLETVLGNGQYYVPSNTTIEKQEQENKPGDSGKAE